MISRSQARSALLPHGALPARLIVCEPTARWAAALSRDVGEFRHAVFQARSLADAMAALAESPASFFVAELSEKYADPLARLLVEVQRRFPLARTGVVAERALARYEGWMLEAGAVCFVAGVRALGPLTHAACRHLAEVPGPPQSLAERVWASLPWPREANR